MPTHSCRVPVGLRAPPMARFSTVLPAVRSKGSLRILGSLPQQPGFEPATISLGAETQVGHLALQEQHSDPRVGLNTYAYVGGNPLGYIDPLGLCDCSNVLNTAQATASKPNLASVYSYAGDHAPGPNTNKCNTFVGDMLSGTGVGPKRWLGFGEPISAGDWADPTKDIPHFPVVATPQPGDIVAVSHHYSDASGHVAIVKVPGKSTIGAGTATGAHETGWPWDPTTSPQGTPVYKRCTCS